MDDLITASGVAYRALTNPYFMEDTARQAESIKNQGVFSYPIAGDRKLPAVATRDIAAAASRLLLDASWSGVGEVPLLGPEDLSYNDMAEIMSQVLGEDVRFQQITFEAYKHRFVRLGMSDAMAQGYADMAWAKNEGLDNGVRRTPENSTPTSFRQWCEEVLKPAVARSHRLARTHARAGHMPASKNAGLCGKPASRANGQVTVQNEADLVPLAAVRCWLYRVTRRAAQAVMGR
jgi:hypothetical protein